MGAVSTVEALELHACTVNWFDYFGPVFDTPKFKNSYGNLKFGQKISCREREDLQLWFWAKIDLELRLGRKTPQSSVRVEY